MIEMTLHEKHLVILEFTKRIKDIVFMDARNKVYDMMEHAIKNLSLNEDAEKITVCYEVTFTVGDIMQILGRIRRP